MRHLTQDELVLLYYRESGADERRADEHLRSCDLCRREFADINRALEVAGSLPVPERNENYGAEVWAQLQPRLKQKLERRWSFLIPIHTWALAGGFAVLLAMAFWGGRVWQMRQAPAAASISPNARERILMVAVGDHLERAQMLLVELMNEGPAGSVDVSQTKQLAQDLVQSNRLYRQTALRDGQAGMADVLDGLERILLQISHSPDEISADDLASLRHQIEAEGILFKVRVIELQVQEKQKTTGPNRAGTAL